MSKILMPFPVGCSGPRDANGLPIWRVSYTHEGKRKIFLVGAPHAVNAKAWANRYKLADVVVGRWRGGEQVPSRNTRKVSYKLPTSSAACERATLTMLDARNAAYCAMLGDAHGPSDKSTASVAVV